MTYSDEEIDRLTAYCRAHPVEYVVKAVIDQIHNWATDSQWLTDHPDEAARVIAQDKKLRRECATIKARETKRAERKAKFEAMEAEAGMATAWGAE